MTVMRSLSRAGKEIAWMQRGATKSPFSNGVAPEANMEAAHVLVEANSTYVIARGSGTKAMVTYASM